MQLDEGSTIMDFINELNDAIQLGLHDFQEFIQQKIRTNKDYLKQLFWLADGSQMTVLNYLIYLHQERNEDQELGDQAIDLTKFIDYIMAQTSDRNIGEPVHQAIAAGKINLASHLVDAIKKDPSFNFEQRDADGRSLLSLVLRTKDENLLRRILDRKPNVNAATFMTRIPFQPLHQAVVLDFAAGVTLLAQQGAQLANPVGGKSETPVLLAARLGKINALEALLELPAQNLQLEAKNSNHYENKLAGYTAVEELCMRIDTNNKPKEAIKGVAMLLCCGAEPPHDEEMRKLLSSNRELLLKAVHEFLEDKPGLVDAFVNRCHLKESTLHNIVYADHSWGSSIRHLFGRPSDAAFIIEDLVSRKYTNQSVLQPDAPALSRAASEKSSTENESLKLYAEFVQRYTQAYNSQRITNRWSSMRWMIADGQCDWDTVLRYAKNHPSSRTKIIIDEMLAPAAIVHENVDGSPQTKPVLM